MDSLVWVVVAIAILALTAALVVWTNALIRGYTSANAAVLARSPIPMVVCGVLLAACAAVPAVAPINSDNVSFLLLPALFLALFGAMFAQYYLVFWAADAAGLTRQALFLKTTLPWHEIDWVYGSVKTTNYRAYGIVKVGQSTQHDLVVEAGPKRKIKVTLKAFLSGGKPDALLRAIERQATSAQFGFDKFTAVRQRRAASAPVVGR